MSKPSVFISYSSKNRDKAENIQHQLESSGFDVWRDKNRLETDWSQEIAQALADRDVLFLIWSEQASQSRWVKHEWLTARALEKTIIVWRLPGAPKTPEPLHNLQDINSQSVKKCGQELISRLAGRQNFTKKYDYTVLPKNSYIPFNPNPNFTGRGQDLLELYMKLIGNLNKIGINQLGTVGMGGIGKTQLVVEFTYRFSFAFDSVHWIQAGDERKWLQQFVELARDNLQLTINCGPDKPEADKQYIYALQKYCRENPDTLIIMDNVIEPKLLNSESILVGLTPLTLGSDLLFTTRKHFRLPGVSSQAINILSKECAYKLLISYCAPQTLDEERYASSICNAVGYLPLAIILVGAFLNRYTSETPYLDYHDELLENRLDTIDIVEISDKELATRHESAVTTTLKDQWDALDDEKAKTLFQLSGQFSEAEIIPKPRLGLFGGIGPGKSKLDQPLRKAFDLLEDLNLIEKLEGNANATRLHPLVRAFARRLLPEKQRATFKSSAAKKFKAAIFGYSRLQKEIEQRGVKQLLSDIRVAIDWWGEDAEGLQELKLLEGALRLSFNQLLEASDQLVTHLFGRLMFSKAPNLINLLKQAANNQRGIWLRPLAPSLMPPDGPLLRTLEGHGDIITAIAIAHDGKTVVSASRDRTLKVWNLKSGEVIQTLEGHEGAVEAVAIAPDGKTVVSSSGATLKVWDLKSGDILQTLEGHKGRITAVSISPDSKTAVSACHDHTLKVWYLKTGECIQTLEGHSRWVTDLAITPDGKKVVSISNDNTLKVWYLKTGECIKTIERRNYIGGILANIADDKTILFSPDSTTVFEVLDLKTGECTQILIGRASRVLAITPDGKTAVVNTLDMTLEVRDLHSGEAPKTLGTTGFNINVGAITPDGNIAVSASLFGSILKVWDLHAGEVQETLNRHSKDLETIVVAPDGKTVISASDDTVLKVCDLESGECFQTLKGYKVRAMTLAITSDGKTAMSASSYGEKLKVWDLKTGKCIQTMKIDHGDVTNLAISPDGKRAVLAFWNKIIKEWDLQSNECIQTLDLDRWRTTDIAIAPDSKTAVAACDDGTLMVWDLKARECIHILERHGWEAIHVTITTDSKTAVSTGGDSTLKVWDLETGECIQTLRSHAGFTNIAITADRQVVVSTSGRILKVWDVQSGLEISHFYADDALVACSISPNGKTIVAVESSGRSHFLMIKGMGKGQRSTANLR